MPVMVREMAVEARNFFDESWTKKGFTDKGLTPWKPVHDKDGNVKERPLVQSGALRRSIRTEINGLSAIIYTEIPYAQIHNEGGPVRWIGSVRAHMRKGKPVRTHNRTVDHVMPQRQFMGHSAVLDQIHTGIITSHLNKILHAG